MPIEEEDGQIVSLADSHIKRVHGCFGYFK